MFLVGHLGYIAVRNLANIISVKVCKAVFYLVIASVMCLWVWILLMFVCDQQNIYENIILLAVQNVNRYTYDSLLKRFTVH